MLGLGLDLSPQAVRAARGMIGFPTPTLDLSFMNGALDSRIAFSRASAATYTDSTGTLRTVGYNLLTWSEDFSNAAWVKLTSGTGSLPVVTANAGTDPLGAPTADRVVFALNGGTTSTDQSTLYQAVPTTIGVTYTYSIWLRTEDGSTKTLRMDFNPGSGSTPLFTVTGTWARFSSTRTAAGTSDFAMLRLRGGTGSSDSATVLAWGAMLETSPTLSDYSPTTTTAASTPRFDYAITSSTTNLALQSQTMTSATWTKTNATVSGSVATSPIGDMTADAIVESVVAATSRSIQQVVAFTAGTAYTFSVYAKRGTGTRNLRLWFGTGAFGANVHAGFDLGAGTIPATSGGAIGGITALANGWFRLTATATATTSATSNFQIMLLNAAYSGTFDGDGSSSALVWGAQCEAASSLGPYVATTSAAATVNTTEARGLLIEEARSNLLLRSGDFSASGTWAAGPGGSATVTAGPAGAPDGANWWTLDDANAGATLGRMQTVTITSGTGTYTGSIYLKAGTSSVASVRFATSGGTAVIGEGVINLATGATQWRTATAGTSLSAVAGPGGSWRLAVTITDNGSGNTSLLMEARPAFATTYSPTLDNAATGTVHVACAQVEAGAFPTSYIPTISTTASRAADLATMSDISWLNQAAGTMFAEFSLAAIQTTSSLQTVWSLDDATGNERHTLRVATGGMGAPVVDGGVVQASVGNGLITAGTVYRHTHAYALNDFHSAANGTLASPDTSGTLPTVTRMTLGNRLSVDPLNGYIRRIKFYNSRLANSTLQSITA